MNMYVVLMCSRGCSDDGSQGKAEGEISESAATLRGARGRSSASGGRLAR